MRPRAHLLLPYLLLFGSSGCGADAATPPPAEAAPAPDEKFRQSIELQCQTDRASGLVLDHGAGAVGEPTPELAARTQLELDGVDRSQFTESVLTDATGSTFVDYRTSDDRLVLYVEVAPAAEDTGLAAYVHGCADETRGG